MVLLPLPLLPTKPTLYPAGNSAEIPFRTSGASGAYANSTFSSFTLPSILGRVIALSFVCSVGVFKISPSLSTDKSVC